MLEVGAQLRIDKLDRMVVELAALPDQDLIGIIGVAARQNKIQSEEDLLQRLSLALQQRPAQQAPAAAAILFLYRLEVEYP